MATRDVWMARFHTGSAHCIAYLLAVQGWTWSRPRSSVQRTTSCDPFHDARRYLEPTPCGTYGHWTDTHTCPWDSLLTEHLKRHRTHHKDLCCMPGTANQAAEGATAATWYSNSSMDQAWNRPVCSEQGRLPPHHRLPLNVPLGLQTQGHFQQGCRGDHEWGLQPIRSTRRNTVRQWTTVHRTTVQGHVPEMVHHSQDIVSTLPQVKRTGRTDGPDGQIPP